jgi:hypothetical protein
MPTFTQIGTAQVVASSGSVTTITFSAIPSTYTDLVLFLSARSDTVGSRDGLLLTFNNQGSTYYSTKELRGYDSNATGSTSTSGTSRIDTMRIPASSATSSTFGNISFYIPNYAGNTAKSVSIDSVSENNSSTAWYIDLAAGLYNQTTAISSIELKAEAGYYVQNSTAYLYGVSNA